MYRMTEEDFAAHNKRILKQAEDMNKPKRTTRIETPTFGYEYKSEHDIQVTFIKFLALLELKEPCLKLGFAVPNGGMRHAAVAGKLKAEGVKSGVPDWHLPVARKMWKGLWIEFKFNKGKLSDNQVEYIAMLRAEGHHVEVCYSAEEALAQVMRYLDIDHKFIL